MGSEKQRKKVIDELRDTFLKSPETSILREGLIPQICLRYGVTKDKAQEYLQVLLDAKFIKEDNFGLWLSDDFIGDLKNGG